MNTPVLLIIFNRPKHTQALVDALRGVKPARIYVAADGPRSDRPDEGEKCAATRAVIDSIDWPCELFKNYAEDNMGCGPRPASAITWVFEHEERAIILEDDCIPDTSFFPFCEELLERYQEDQRIMQICGSNHVDGHLEIKESYLFSNYSLCWGWATWKRAWDLFDYEMTTWPEYRAQDMLRNVVTAPKEIAYWEKNFENSYSGDQSIWDVRWLFSIWSNNGLSVIPRNNLVSNVGFGKEASHTYNQDDQCNNRATKQIQFPLIYPPIMSPSIKHDHLLEKMFFVASPWYQPLKNLLKKLLPTEALKAYQRRKYGTVLSQ